jgi:hypothetical protein
MIPHMAAHAGANELPLLNNIGQVGISEATVTHVIARQFPEFPDDLMILLSHPAT